MMWGTGWDDWIVGVLTMVLFWVGLVALVVFALRNWGGDGSGRGEARHPDARAILEERFARGEISEDEFVQRREVLHHAAS